MPAVSGITINFDSSGNSLSYLGGGWARAEEQFTWETGKESHLPLPLGKEPREFILTMEVIERIRSRGETPFLHVREDNVRAIELYQRLGFRQRALLHFAVLRKL